MEVRQIRIGVLGCGNVGAALVQLIADQAKEIEARTVVLGHLLRGGGPTAFDRLLGLRFGAAAVRALEEGESGVMVALDPPNVYYVPIGEATSRLKNVPLDCDTILTARDMGINFGDEMPGASDPQEYTHESLHWEEFSDDG